MDDPALRRTLLQWYDAHRRDLPWRRTHNPYAVLVSEAMLQQTRVETVLPYYERWMERLPTVAALAAADEDDALALWSGLGYYRRARNLHAAARTVMTEHAGHLPRTAEGLLELPGVGPYTAAAVASIAFGEPVAAVDGNVVRVLARLDAVRGDVARPATRRRLERRAQRLLDPRRPGDWNQAVMDLGATVCTPRRPRCKECPLRTACKAAAAGIAQRIPESAARKPAPTVHVAFAAVAERGRILMVRESEGGLLRGLWRLPGGAQGGSLAAAVREQTGLRVRVAPRGIALEHAFSHRIWLMKVHRARVLAGPAQPARPAPGAAWVPLVELHRRPLSTAMRRALGAAGFEVPERRAKGRPPLGEP
ncbi:MAG TPA: A/G-specific adenine glycosylase [Candidatus Thermoplasmatota archaeon]|nr:A/G-specific adenine glycosylase [Candidatus Thermoplasmatota archaeon]